MNKNINIIAIVGIAVAVVFGVSYLKPTEITNVVNVPEQEEASGQTLSGYVGPERLERFESINGVGFYYDSVKFNQASTTVCDITTPPSTTTLKFASGGLLKATSTTVQFEWGKSTYPAATTTSFGTFQLTANQKATMIASTSPLGASIDPMYVLAPSTHLTLKYGGQNGSANVFIGYCKTILLAN